MPIALVDPNVASGSSPHGPVNPVGNLMGNIINAYGRNLLNPLEQSEMQLRQAQTQEEKNKIAAPGQIADIFQRGYATVPSDNVGPDGNAAPSPPRNPSANLPELAGALANAGQYGQIGNLFRTYVANMPGVQTKAVNGTPSPVDMAMLGAGDSYGSTIGGMREHEALDTQRELAKIQATAKFGMTGAIKDHNFKVQQIMENQGVDQPTAEGIVDGVLRVETDPSTRNAFLVNVAKGTSQLLRSPAQGATGTTPPGDNTVAAPVKLSNDSDYLTQLTTPGGSAAAPSSAPAAAPTLPTLDRGSLGIPFDQIYGGPATASRLAGGASALLGNSDANSGQTSGLQSVNDIIQRAIAIKGMQAGVRNNAAVQGRIARQYPTADPSLQDREDLLAQGATAPGTAEDMVNNGLSGLMHDRMSDQQSLSNPNMSSEERSFAQQRIDQTDKLMADVLKSNPDLLKQYQAATGSRIGVVQAPPASNYTKLKGATGADVPVVRKSADAAKLPIGSFFKDGAGNTFEVLAAGQYKKVQ